jgi:hypothetical protein
MGGRGITHYYIRKLKRKEKKNTLNSASHVNLLSNFLNIEIEIYLDKKIKLKHLSQYRN